ncbi:GspH/FimT family pseudopilin [Motiliproteus sp.]|uniref:GspH/FimT family pseudopilin n=1 Tax=Motiliproteus sp. TaxID=1898955 RepID=UPI003BAB0F52
MQKGFTLIELLITVSLIAILAGLVAPGFSSFIQDNRLTSQINTLIGVIHMARGEAANRRGIVTLCASDNGSNCNTTNWEAGWILFTDSNNGGNAVIDGDDQLLLYQEPLIGGNSLRASGFGGTNLGRLQFASTGFLLDTDSSAGTFTLCDDRGVSEARAIVVNISGVSRLAVDEDGDNTLNNHQGAAGEISC